VWSLITYLPRRWRSLDELAALSKKRVDTLQSGIHVGVNEKEANEYDQSRVSISKLCELLEKFIDNDVRNWS
jgi:hypothetical protein